MTFHPPPNGILTPPQNIRWQDSVNSAYFDSLRVGGFVIAFVINHDANLQFSENHCQMEIRLNRVSRKTQRFFCIIMRYDCIKTCPLVPLLRAAGARKQSRISAGASMTRNTIQLSAPIAELAQSALLSLRGGIWRIIRCRLISLFAAIE